jgi:hypothetical protein
MADGFHIKTIQKKAEVYVVAKIVIGEFISKFWIRLEEQGPAP